MNLQTMQWTTQHKFLIPLIASGIFVGVLLGTAGDAWSTTLFLSIFSLALCGIAVFVVRYRTVLLVGILLFVLSALLGSVRTSLFDTSIPRQLVAFENKKIELYGTVHNSPEYKEASARFQLNVERVGDTPVRGLVLVSTNPYNAVSYGDSVRVSGTLKHPEPFETDEGRIFEYDTYLHTHRITHIMSFGTVEILASPVHKTIQGYLESLKQSLVKRIEYVFRDPEAPLLAGLLLGEKQSLGEKIYSAFQRAGVVHMIVLSGYNVSLVVQALLKITGTLLPRTMSAVVAVFGIVGFALMTGASETTVRASIMAGILILGSFLHRPHSAPRALIIAGSIMILINPYLLLYDLSFQLSFAATAGILFFADRIARRLTWLPERFGIREIGGATLAAQFAAFPFLLTSFGNISLISPVTNIAVLGAVPWAMFFGFIAVVLSFINVWLALPFTLLADALLVYILKVSIFFGNLPFATLVVPPGATLPLLLLVLASYGYVAVRTLRQKSL